MVDWQSFASHEAEPSAFSRSGFGIWDVIKPEVVEYGGDFFHNSHIVSYPTGGRSAYPELVRTTNTTSPPYDRDAVGTSFAAPKVTHTAVLLQTLLPDSPCLLYRALIAQSARWPVWADEDSVDKQLVFRCLGYGIPDVERATTNSDHRVTLITPNQAAIKAKEGHVYRVPIPSIMRSAADEYQVLIEVTLSYSAQPRRTRRNLRRYLSVWLDWTSSQMNESIDSFMHRALKDQPTVDKSKSAKGFAWTVGAQAKHGEVEGAKRSAGTLQKDWTIVDSNKLPKDFCISVRGHEGWSKDPDAAANYVLTVSFELLNKELPIYEDLRVELEELRAQVDVPTEPITEE